MKRTPKILTVMVKVALLPLGLATFLTWSMRTGFSMPISSSSSIILISVSGVEFSGISSGWAFSSEGKSAVS
jgi:hypothetical protein